MSSTSQRVPQQSRSQQTLERILSSSTSLISETTYDDVSISDIASHAEISVGGFYSRFESKAALFDALQGRFARETQDRIDAALAADWSKTSLRMLLRFIVAGNAEIYDKYRGVLSAIYLRTRVFESHIDDEHRRYNENIVAQIEKLILLKGHEIKRPHRNMAIRTAIACMTAMLREAIVFRDTSLYPEPGSISTVTRCIADIMYYHLVAELQ